MGVLFNKISRDELKPGDHIYSWRQAYIYAHHGIYVGEGKVIHFTQGGGEEIGTTTFLDRAISCSSYDSGGVISSCIDCFLAGGDLYRFEYGVSYVSFLAKVRGGTCTLASCDSPEEVLHRARYLLKNGFGVYHLSKNNCEDFAIYCKTGRIVITNIGVGQSGQAASFNAVVKAINISSSLTYLATRFRGLATMGGGGLAAVGRGALAAVGGGALAAVGCGTYYYVSRLNSDIGVRSDAVIVPVETLCVLFQTATGNVSKED